MRVPSRHAVPIRQDKSHGILAVVIRRRKGSYEHRGVRRKILCELAQLTRPCDELNGDLKATRTQPAYDGIAVGSHKVEDADNSLIVKWVGRDATIKEEADGAARSEPAVDAFQVANAGGTKPTRLTCTSSDAFKDHRGAIGNETRHRGPFHCRSDHLFEGIHAVYSIRESVRAELVEWFEA